MITEIQKRRKKNQRSRKSRAMESTLIILDGGCWVDVKIFREDSSNILQN